MKRLIFFFLFFSMYSYAQQSYTLKEYIVLIEQEYDVKFSYSEDVISKKNIQIFSQKKKALDTIIQNIEHQTKLVVKKKVIDITSSPYQKSFFLYADLC